MPTDELQPFEAIAIAIALLQTLDSVGVLSRPAEGVENIIEGLREAFAEVVNHG